jgi:hypothetical protein
MGCADCGGRWEHRKAIYSGRIARYVGYACIRSEAKAHEERSNPKSNLPRFVVATISEVRLRDVDGITDREGGFSYIL